MKTFTKSVVTTAPRLVISYDNDPESPRSWSNLGYFITVDRDYHSPDKNEMIELVIKRTGDEAQDQDDHIKLIKEELESETNIKVKAIYPVVKYEHSGVSYSLGTKHNFDYSNNGFYIVTEKTAKELGTAKKDFKKVIQQELKIFNQYCNGEVYSFVLHDKSGEFEDSCCGFYSIEDIRDHLPKEWENEDLTEYIKE